MENIHFIASRHVWLGHTVLQFDPKNLSGGEEAGCGGPGLVWYTWSAVVRPV